MLKTLLVLAGLVLSAVPLWAGRVVVMRGVYDETARTNTYDYVGDETSLAAATLSGVSGDEVIEGNRAKLRQEVDLYYAAQKAAGVADPKPLYVLLDAKGDWVYARWGSSFMLRKPDGTEERVTGGFIHMGETVDYMNQQRAEELSRESNRALLSVVNRYYAAHYVKRDHRALAQALFREAPCIRSLSVADGPWEAHVSSLREQYKQVGCDLAKFDAAVAAFASANPGTPESFESAVNSQYKFSIPGDTDTSFAVYVENLSHSQFAEQIKALVSRDQTARGAADPTAIFKSAEATDIEKEYQRKATVGGVNAAVTHEIGHLVHFEAGQGLGFGPVYTGIAGAPSRHSATTLSNPGFALVEGWAEAAAFRYSDGPTAQDRRRATHIDYDDSVSNLQRFLNDKMLQGVGSALRAKGLLRDNTIPIEGASTDRSTPADFDRALKAAAEKLGLSAEEFDRAAAGVRADPALSTAQRRYAYTAHLQAHAGEKKKRTDFLASEASVAYTLQELDAVLGGKFFEKAVVVMSEKHPEGMGPLLEAYVAKYPADRMMVYATLAKVTDGILLTQDQVSLLEANPRLHADLDRDGKTPGPSANVAHAAAFPPETSTFGPVPGLDPTAPPLSYDDGTRIMASTGRPSTAGLVAVPASDTRPTWEPVGSGITPMATDAPGETAAEPAGETPVTAPSTGPRTIPPATLPDDADLNRR